MATNENGGAVPFHVTLRELPLPVRLVLSLFLLAVGLGYFSALVQLHFQNASRGEPLPTPNDVVEIFSGVQNWPVQMPAPPKPVSKMEKLIMAPEDLPHNGSGTMGFAFFGKRLPPVKRPEREGERLAVQAWINAPDAERKEAYDGDAFPLPASLADHPITKDYMADGKVRVKSLIQARCDKCHGEEGLQGKIKLSDYSDFADVLTVPVVGHTSRQMSLEHLTQTTHLHLLSFCVLWTLTGLIFAFSSYPRWLRCVLGPIVLLAQVADVSCWWLARLGGRRPLLRSGHHRHRDRRGHRPGAADRPEPVQHVSGAGQDRVAAAVRGGRGERGVAGTARRGVPEPGEGAHDDGTRAGVRGRNEFGPCFPGSHHLARMVVSP